MLKNEKYQLLNQMAKHERLMTKPHLKGGHKGNKRYWAKEKMKNNFSTIHFNNE